MADPAPPRHAPAEPAGQVVILERVGRPEAQRRHVRPVHSLMRGVARPQLRGGHRPVAHHPEGDDLAAGHGPLLAGDGPDDVAAAQQRERVRLVLDAQAQRDVAPGGRGGEDGAEPGSQRVGVDGHRQRHALQPAAELRLGLRLQQGHAAGGLHEHLTGVGHPDWAGAAHEHAARVALHGLDPLADRGRCHAEGRGGGLEAALLHECEQGLQVRRVHPSQPNASTIVSPDIDRRRGAGAATARPARKGAPELRS